jgi:hypothetical protein
MKVGRMILYGQRRERKKSHTKDEVSCEPRKVWQRLENKDKENSHTKHIMYIEERFCTEGMMITMCISGCLKQPLR